MSKKRAVRCARLGDRRRQSGAEMLGAFGAAALRSRPPARYSLRRDRRKLRTDSRTDAGISVAMASRDSSGVRR
jgi:hypothetical protein